MTISALFFPSFILFSGFINNRLLKHVAISGPIVKIVLLILLIFSVISWAIVLLKYRAFRGVEKEQERFLDLFYEGKTLNQLLDYAEASGSKVPMIQVFKAGYTELIRFKRGARQEAGLRVSEGGDGARRACKVKRDGAQRPGEPRCIQAGDGFRPGELDNIT